jgi:polyisoprenoid-binding protein YceI
MAQVPTTAQPVMLAPGVWDIDPSHSNVEFVSRHLFSRVRGRFTEFSGVITVGAEPGESSVEVTVQAASIDTGHHERDAHLRGPEFLDTERFPTLRFRSTSVGEPEPGGHVRLEGDLTIRGMTRSVVLAVDYLGSSEDPWGGRRAGFSARTEIDRDDFGATWNVVLETGGLLVAKTVAIELEIEAVLRQA